MAGTSALSACLLLLLAMKLEVAVSEDDSPVVTLPQGVLKGQKVTSGAGASYYTFHGIPFAKPPVGELRFKAPQDPEPWNGTLEAIKEGHECKQFNLLDKKFVGDEDCLFVNVYTPELPGSGSPKPVMVWIHGGGFSMGSGNKRFQDPELLLDAGVIFVSFNYRLGPFGFLSTEDSAIPGNAGMKDQVQALRWVQQNIASFGGDPNKVTTFGESAGGASVHYLMVSPMSKGLFRGAIAQSGTVSSPWAVAVKPKETAFLLGTALGFTGNGSQELAEFLRGVDAQKLVETSLVAIPDRDKDRLLKIPFVPSIEPTVEGESPFLPAHPIRLLEEGKFHNVPFITGVTSAEGLAILKAGGVHEGSDKLKEVDNVFAKIFGRDLRSCGEETCDGELIASIKNFYFGNQPLGNDTFENLTQMVTDMAFTEGMVISLNLMSAQGNAPLYMYHFTYDGGFGFLKNLLGLQNYSGVAHGDDVGYLFKLSFLNSQDPTDLKVRSEIITMWTNFAKTGNPTSGVTDGNIPIWLPYSKSETNYLDIGSELLMKKDLNKERVDFWGELYESSKKKY